MKLVLTSVLLLFLTSVNAQSNWQLIYQNDKDGNAISGDLNQLLQAVREGKSIRLGWKSQRPNESKRKVEHVTEAKFLTILSEEIVFAQIDPIIGQTPNYDKQEVILKENLSWVLIAGTNGKMEGMMRHVVTGEIVGHGQRQSPFDWYVSN